MWKNKVENMIRMRQNGKKFTDSNDAVVGVFVAILLIGLIFAVIAMVQTVYVPTWMEQKEAEHMDAVANQFSQLKFAIDTQAINHAQNIPLSTSITLGSKELPFLTSSRAFGSLEILSNAYKVTITNDTESFSYPLGIVRYSSTNAYFLDQSYIYENGALILSQFPGSVMSVQPAFSVVDNTDLSFTIIDILEIGGKTSASGYGTYPVQTKFLHADPPLVITDVENITIDTSYQNAWHIFLDTVLTRSKLEFNIITDAPEGITVTFPDKPNLVLNVIGINAQIAPGWVE